MENRFKWKSLFMVCTLVSVGLMTGCGEDEGTSIENVAPIVANSLSDVNLDEGFGSQSIAFGSVFSDEDGDQLSYAVLSSNQNVVTVVASSEALTITEVGVGVSTITLTADDGNGGEISDSFEVAVNATANNAPTIVSALADLEVDAGFGTREIDFSNVFSDGDGDPLNYNASSSVTNAATVSISGTTLTIAEVGVGTTIITLRAMDGNGGMTGDEFELIINSVNGPPTVESALADISLTEGFGSQVIDVSSVFADPDQDVLTYDASSSAEAVATVAISGTMITVTEVAVGTAAIAVTANDGNGGSVSDTFDLTINSASSAEVVLTFGTNAGNSIEISSWTTVTADGYVVVMSDESSISNRTDGEEPLASSTYVGTNEQVIYKGATTGAINITLLQDVTTYYFKVFPYTGNFVFDNTQEIQESATASCATSSTTENEVCFEISGDLRIVTSNQYPSHAVGNFPNGTPTAITVTRELDLTPALANEVTYVYNETGGPTPMNRNFYQFGIATNGVEFHPMGLKPWSHPNTGEENWEWQAQVTQEGQTDLDAYGAHVTSQGNYHYHGDIVALAEDEDGSRHSVLYGFAGDGYPIYYKYGYTDPTDPTSSIKELLSSHQLKSGSRTGTGTAGEDYPDGTHDGTYIQDYEFVDGLGDLDECNGRTGVTPEFPDGTYYYVITSDFPVTPNCFKGTPDSDWKIGN